MKAQKNRLGVLGSFKLMGANLRDNPERVAFLMHRITGIILVGFIFAHIISTNSLARNGWEHWMAVEVEHLRTLNPISLAFFIAMGAAVFHGLNGIRLLLVEALALWIGRPEKPKPPYVAPSLKGFQRRAIYAVFALWLIIWAAIGYVMFLW
ncbi:MAG: succinate dehydrogenase [Acidilobaceae archaeon]|nr:succinate dehydrogenase [Acidilobaceae archaeon]